MQEKVSHNMPRWISPGPRHMYPFCNKASFHSEELLAPHPTHKLEDHPLSVFRDCIFNIFAATLHIGGCSSICSLRIRHVTGTHLSWSWRICYLKFIRGQENNSYRKTQQDATVYQNFIIPYFK